MKRTKKQGTYSEPRRLSYPEAESEIAWISMILDAYYTADLGVYQAIDKELSSGKRVLACSKGCSSCCRTHVTIPVYPLELLGLYWYMLDVVEENTRETLIRQLYEFAPGKGCPFLIEGACGVHPLRPLACRFFNVFTKPCEEGEDPYYTRRHDVLTPDDKVKDKALSFMLPYHGIIQRSERREAMRNGYMHQFIKNLQEINWPKVALQLSKGDKTPYSARG
jgi:Fe-S-cluster containining protein